MTESAPNLAPPTLQELISLRQRFVVRIRRAANNGVGWLVFGLVMLGSCALAGRIYWDLSARRTDTLEERIANILETQATFPQGKFRRLGLVGAILAQANRSVTLEGMDCDDKAPDCRTMRDLHETFVSLVETALAYEPSNTVAGGSADSDCGKWPPSVPFWQQLAIVRPRQSAASIWRETCRVGRKVAASKPFHLETCGRPSATLSGQRLAGFGKVRCLTRQSVGLSDLIVPAQLNPDKADPSHASEPPPVIRSRVRRALWLSKLLDLALEATVPTEILEGSEGDSEEWRLVQAYFISVDSVLRLWQRTPLDPHKHFPQAHLWAAAPYFTDFLGPDAPADQLTTPLYLDVGGQGMVRTTCSAIERRTPGGDRVQEFVGIFCTDFAVPESKFIDAVAESPLFRVATVDSALNPTSDQVNIHFANASNDLASGSHPVGWNPWSDDRALEEALKTAVADALKSSPKARSDLTLLSVSQQRAYFLPLANHRNHRLKAMILFPSRLSPTQLEGLCRNVAIGTGAATIIAAAFGWVVKRRNVELERRLAMLRNLPVGVIEVNGAKEIEFANDRAEELLDAHLPKSGRDSRFVSLDTLVHQWLFREDKITMCTLDDVGRARRQGDRSTYYARVPERSGISPARWVRISGTPVLALGSLGWLTARRVAFSWAHVLRRRGETPGPSSVAVVEPVSEVMRLRLESLHWERSPR